jgi:phage-related protein
MATLTFPDHLLGTSAETYEPMQVEHIPRVRLAKFGDGYEQRVQDGINNDPQKWTMAFSKRSGTDIDGVDDFFKARGGYESFFWTPRGEATPRKFVCRKWTRKYDVYDVVQSINFVLEEVFE